MRQLILLPWDQLDPTPFLPNRRVLTPNRRAARAVGQPTESLESFARKRLRGGPFGLAPRLSGHRLMIELASLLPGVDDPEGLARSATPVIRTFLRAGLDLAAVEAQGGPRVARLASLARVYQDRLRADGLIDPTEALKVAALQTLPGENLLVTGYPRLGRDERAFIDAAAGDGSVVLLPYLEHANYQDNLEVGAFFEARGWEVTRGDRAPMTLEGCFRPAAPEVEPCVYGNEEDELRGALGRIKGWLADGVPADQIALVARQDSDYGPLALEIAWEYGVPLRALYGVPVTETRFGSWVQHLVDAVVGELAFEPTLRFLAHPLSPWFPPEKRQEARQRHPSGEAAWRTLGVDLDALVWPAEDTRGGWRTTMMRLLQALGVKRLAARWPQAMLACRALVEVLPVLQTPTDETISRETFARELVDVLGLMTVPAQPGRGGVELHTPLSLYGASYRHVIVVGMAENVLPAPIANSPVLDFHDRHRLAQLGHALEDAAGAARREFLSFAALLRTATESLTLSYPRLMANRTALPSAYFGYLALHPTAPNHDAVYSHEEARRVWLARQDAVDDPVLAGAAHALEVERSREAAGPPDEYDGVVGLPIDPAERVFSPSQLTVLGQCAFKWLLQYAMRLAVLEEPEDDLQPNTRGSLYHKALELAVRASLDEPDVRQGVLDRLEGALLEAERELDLPPLPAWESRRLEHLACLRRAVEGADFLLPGARPARLEEKFEGTWHGLKVRGVVDRIDTSDTGPVLIDYKTSSKAPSGAQDANRYAKLDLQLPIYIQVPAATLYPGQAVREAVYYSLTKGKVLRKAKVDEPALVAFAERVKGHLREGHYPVQPDLGREACTYCDFGIACRVGARTARKEATP